MKLTEMELASAIVVLVLLAALAAIGLVALFSRARPLYLLGSLAAAGVLTWQAAASLRGASYCEFLQSSRRIQEFDLSGDGDKTMRINRLPEVDGLQAFLVTRSGKSLKNLDLSACLWRARDSAGPVEIDLQASHTRLFDLDWNEGFGEGDRTWVEVTYRLDDSSRPILSDLQLLSMPCRNELMWSDFALLQFHIMAGFFALSALASSAGVITQIIRRTRGSDVFNRESRIENRESFR